jgi:prepilin-type N-terminal cleavage/methylation domain-containing protein
MKQGLRQKSAKRGLPRRNTSTWKRSLRCQGFTLVELLVVLAIVSVIMTAIYSVFIHSNRVYLSQEEVVAAQQEARSALDILGREIRMAGFIAAYNKPGGGDRITSPAYGAGSADSAIEIAAVDNTLSRTTTLAFKSNLDGADTDFDGNDDTEAVRYVYYHSDHPNASRRNTLTREVRLWNGGWTNISGGEQLFLENIQNLTFTYQMADGTTSVNPASLEDIRGVVISLTAQTSIAVEPFEGGKGIRTRQLISNIQIRNLGLS